MSVRLSNEVEREMAQERERNREKVSWEIYRTTSLVEAVHKAREAGWVKSLVQVRQETINGFSEYVVEPYEGRDCGCAGLLNYSDYFLPPHHEEISEVNKEEENS